MSVFGLYWNLSVHPSVCPCIHVSVCVYKILVSVKALAGSINSFESCHALIEVVLCLGIKCSSFNYFYSNILNLFYYHFRMRPPTRNLS